MANIKLHLIHLEELAKKQLEEEKDHTFLLRCIMWGLVFNLTVLIFLIGRGQ